MTVLYFLTPQTIGLVRLKRIFKGPTLFNNEYGYGSKEDF
jgi:hypothetical protein